MKNWVAKQAIKTAKESSYPHFRHGAVIECGGRVLSKNPNIKKSKTPAASMSVHAEIATLKPFLSKSRLDKRGKSVNMYVARVSPEDKLVLSKPCDKCMQTLKESGIIKAIFYSTNNGWIEMEI